MGLENELVDVAIIGGGPAGMSAAVWCSDLGLKTVLLEGEADIGGQLVHIHNSIENYLGLRASNGLELLDHFRRTVERSEFTLRLDTRVERVDAQTRKMILASGQVIGWRALVLATGVRRRELGIPGETEFRGRGIIESGARDKDQLRGKSVLIVGGGDAAFENAVLLSEVASSLSVAFRRTSPTARPEFVQTAQSKPNVELLPTTIVKEIRGGATVTNVVVEDTNTGVVKEISTDGVLIRIGVQPNSELLSGIVDLDERSYVSVNGRCETSVAGILAIGDVANPIAPTISTATGTGAIAAKQIFRILESEQGI